MNICDEIKDFGFRIFDFGFIMISDFGILSSEILVFLPQRAQRVSQRSKAKVNNRYFANFAVKKKNLHRGTQRKHRVSQSYHFIADFLAPTSGGLGGKTNGFRISDF